VLIRLASTAVVIALLAGCGDNASGSGEEEAQTGTVEVPTLGACRVLTPADIGQPTNSSEVVDCADEHTAETFAVGSFPGDIPRDAEVDDPSLGAYIYRTCTQKFGKLLGGEESTVMRSILTWAWFRPTESAWERGARWYRCDVVSGNEEADELRPLPETAKGILLGRPDDRWMTCASGETVSGSLKVPCSEPHDWRAVTTIKVGREQDEYPGDRVVELRTRDFCSDSVGAWMNYPVDYEFGYTYFRKAEWDAGNRRSICWARTDQ
jgi:hypothetical protein